MRLLQTLSGRPPASDSRRDGVSAGSAWLVVGLGALLIVGQGYGLSVYGVVIPHLRADTGLALSSSSAGTVGSVVYLGMLVGALLGGRLCDGFGRRPSTLMAGCWTCVWMLCCAGVGAGWELGTARLLTGLGMGALVPAVLAVATEHGPPGRGGLIVTVLMAGVPVGGAAAALVGMLTLSWAGWRALFVVGSLIVLAGVVIGVFVLPRSPVPADRSTRSRVAELFGGFRRQTMFFILAAFTNMMIIYGLSTWLPTVLGMMSYSSVWALGGTLVLSASAVVGSLGLAWLAERWGTRLTALWCAALTAAALTGAVLNGNSVWLFVDIAILGVGTQSALNLVLASVAESYPASVRGSALGWCNGLGRLGAVLAPSLGGWLLAAGLGARAVLVALLCAALLAVLAILGLALDDRHRDGRRPRVGSPASQASVARPWREATDTAPPSQESQGAVPDGPTTTMPPPATDHEKEKMEKEEMEKGGTNEEEEPDSAAGKARNNGSREGVATTRAGVSGVKELLA